MQAGALGSAGSLLHPSPLPLGKIITREGGGGEKKRLFFIVVCDFYINFADCTACFFLFFFFFLFSFLSALFNANGTFLLIAITH